MAITTFRRPAAAVVALTAAFALTACGGSSDNDAKDTEPMKDSTSSTQAGAGADTFGEGCKLIPADGAGSFNGMATAPVASAASANPLLKTLVTAVTEAGLVDTLNSAKALTVFAPTDDAFAKIPEADLNGLLADKPALTKVLTHHVVEGQLGPDELAGEHKTLAGDTITVDGSDENFTVGDAEVLCGNIPTANATVYVIDSVLMP